MTSLLTDTPSWMCAPDTRWTHCVWFRCPSCVTNLSGMSMYSLSLCRAGCCSASNCLSVLVTHHVCRFLLCQQRSIFTARLSWTFRWIDLDCPELKPKLDNTNPWHVGTRQTLRCLHVASGRFQAECNMQLLIFARILCLSTSDEYELLIH